MKNYSNSFRFSFPFHTLFSAAVVSAALSTYSVRAQESTDEEPSAAGAVELAQDDTSEIVEQGVASETAAENTAENVQLAQNDDDTMEEVLVSGRRINLRNAQEIKRNASTIVDAISAQDIGTLPDRSVLEAIQRLPGVSVERFAGPDDPDHFSVEGSGAIIRGMTQTRSEFNGRDSFTANSGRGLSFQDVPPELMGGVEIYKNQTADMIEGGIGGTVSLRTRKPFDSDGRQAALTVDYSYGDLAQEWTPTLSALYSDRWDTDKGEFGFLINVADSSLEGESHGIQSDAFTTYYAANIPGAERFVGDGEGIVYMPNGANSLSKADSREREGLALSGQWASSDGKMEITTEYLRSKARLSWHERAIKNQSGFNTIDRRESTILDGETAVFDDQGLYIAGPIVWGGPTHNGWRVGGNNLDRVSRSYGANALPQFGQKIQFESRIQDTTNLIEDYSINFKWNPTESLELVADAQLIEAETQIDDLSVSLGNFAGYDYDTRGETPVVTYLEPWLGDRDANPEKYDIHPLNQYTVYPGFTGDPAGDSNYFQDPNAYFWRSTLDKYERSEGTSRAATLDATYHFDDGGFVRSIKSGVRYAKREQTIRDTGYDWNSLAPEWSGSYSAGWIVDELYASQFDDVESIDWSDFHRGGVSNIPGDRALFVREAFLRDVMSGRRSPVNPGSGSWEDYPGDSVYDRFAEGDVYDTTETNQAIYARLDFGSDGDLRYSGNIGVRYVNLNRKSRGFINFPDLVSLDSPPESVGSAITPDSVLQYVTDGEFDLFAEGELIDTIAAGEAPTSRQMALWLADPANAWASDENNYLTAEQQAFGNEYAAVQEADVDFNLFLPSFNIKLELTDELIGRFAVAKAAALPDISDVRNRLTLGIFDTVQSVRIRDESDEANPEPLSPRDQLIQSATIIGWQGDGGNPYLKPMESVQYDFALEWYFSEIGQLSTTIFHKNLSNYFIKGAYLQPITNNSTSTTAVVDINSTVNGGSAKMDGLELSYQQFFKGRFDGFGLQATYTYIDASGVPNNEVTTEELAALENSDGFGDQWVGNDAEDPGNRVALDVIPLQGQSKETINLVAMYEKGPWNARLAYNWRSKYLLTTRDVISKSPLFYDSYGLLDGSVFYRINEQIEVGIQGTNLMNTQHETRMVLDNDGLETGRSWFVTDRRVALILRATL